MIIYFKNCIYIMFIYQKPCNKFSYFLCQIYAFMILSIVIYIHNDINIIFFIITEYNKG